MRKASESLSGVLPSEVLRAGRALAILKDWTEIVGDFLGERSYPDRYDRGVVWVSVEGSAWAQEMRMLSRDILLKLNERAGEPNLFVNLRFGVRPIRKVESVVDTIQEPAHDLETLSIREIAERRLSKIRNVP
jgi:hypothetical protein